VQFEFDGNNSINLMHIICEKLETDNTLTSPYVDDFHPLVVPSLNKCRSVFGNENILLVSNSVGGPDDIGYVGADKVEIALGMTVFRRQTKKPKGFTELLAWFNREGNVNRSEGGPIKASDLCMIGDRTLTDVVFGNVHGMLTIHVEHLTSKDDNVVARVLRSAENRWLQPIAKDFLRVKPRPHHVNVPNACFVLNFPEQ
jgi:phosphatidylglycerophosphatase GEP4